MIKAFVLSCGEKTTDLCVSQLKRYGYKVKLLDEIVDIQAKYKQFIIEAYKHNGGVLKVDADVIVNENIEGLVESLNVIQQFKVYNLYTNSVTENGVMYYSERAITEIYNNLHEISKTRPESSACRLPSVNPNHQHIDKIVGLHGFFQDDKGMDRARQHRKERGHPYDEVLIEAIKKL